MINARAIAALGIGFGALAIASMGFIADTPIPSRIITLEVSSAGKTSQKQTHKTARKSKPSQIGELINSEDFVKDRERSIALLAHLAHEDVYFQQHTPQKSHVYSDDNLALLLILTSL